MHSDVYMKLPSDISGALSKNRFRVELLWGLAHILEIYDNFEDFTIVFDYVCDIEVHTPAHGLNFYQIKSNKKSSPYTSTRLTTRKEQTNSIIGKLFLLSCNSCAETPIKAAIVSNVNFKDDDKHEHTEVHTLAFNALTETTQKKLIDKLKAEFPDKMVHLDNLYYIRTHMDLESPKDVVLGKLVEFFEQDGKPNIKKPHALYLSLADAIEDKACYEFVPDSYENVLEKKGITKAYFDTLVSTHLDHSDDIVQKAKEAIERLYVNDYQQRILHLQALSRVTSCKVRDKQLLALQGKITEYVRQNFGALPSGEIDIIESLSTIFKGQLPEGYIDIELKALALIALKTFEGELV